MSSTDTFLAACITNDPTLLHRVDPDDADLLIDDLLTVRGATFEENILKDIEKDLTDFREGW